MKKIISLILVFLLIFTIGFSMVACGDETPDDEKKEDDNDDIPDWSELGGEDDIVLPPVGIKPID